MIKKERAARIAAENRLAEFQKQATEERQARSAALAAERQQAAAERQQAATEREAFMTAITGLAAQVTQLVAQRNGNHRGNSDSPNG